MVINNGYNMENDNGTLSQSFLKWIMKISKQIRKMYIFSSTYKFVKSHTDYLYVSIFVFLSCFNIKM